MDKEVFVRYLQYILQKMAHGGYKNWQHDTRELLRWYSEGHGYSRGLVSFIRILRSMWKTAHDAYMNRISNALALYEEMYRRYRLGLVGWETLVDAAKKLARIALDTHEVEHMWRTLNTVGAHAGYWTALMVKKPEGTEELGSELEEAAKAVRETAREYMRIQAIRTHAQELLEGLNAALQLGGERWAPLVERRVRENVVKIRSAMGKEFPPHPELSDELRVILPALAALHGSEEGKKIAEQELRRAPPREWILERAKYYIRKHPHER